MRSLICIAVAVFMAASPDFAYGQSFFSLPPQQLENPKWDIAEWQPYHECLVSVHADTESRGSGVIVKLEDELTEITAKGVTAKYRVGYIMTCYHVASAARNPNNIIIKYTNSCKTLASIYWMDETTDVCILKTMVPEKYVACKISTGFVTEADELVAVGLGGSKSKIEDKESIRRFKIIASEMTGRNWIRSDECLVPGDSGGPIFNKDGELVGLCSRGFEVFRQFGEDRVVWPAIFCGPESVREAMRGLHTLTKTK